MIRSHIGSTQKYGVILMLKKFSRLSNRSFGLGSPIGLESLSHPLKFWVKIVYNGSQTPNPKFQVKLSNHCTRIPLLKKFMSVT